MTLRPAARTGRQALTGSVRASAVRSACADAPWGSTTRPAAGLSCRAVAPMSRPLPSTADTLGYPRRKQVRPETFVNSISYRLAPPPGRSETRSREAAHRGTPFASFSSAPIPAADSWLDWLDWLEGTDADAV